MWRFTLIHPQPPSGGFFMCEKIFKKQFTSKKCFRYDVSIEAQHSQPGDEK